MFIINKVGSKFRSRCYTVIVNLLQWMKLDDLFEQERNVRHAMSQRMGVLGLMLHQTVDHNPLNPIIVPDME